MHQSKNSQNSYETAFQSKRLQNQDVYKADGAEYNNLISLDALPPPMASAIGCYEPLNQNSFFCAEFPPPPIIPHHDKEVTNVAHFLQQNDRFYGKTFTVEVFLIMLS